MMFLFATVALNCCNISFGISFFTIYLDLKTDLWEHFTAEKPFLLLEKGLVLKGYVNGKTLFSFSIPSQFHYSLILTLTIFMNFHVLLLYTLHLKPRGKPEIVLNSIFFFFGVLQGKD